MANDLPYTTKREAGCFFSFFLILAFVAVAILFVSDEGGRRIIYGLILLVLSVGIAYCRIRLSDPQKPFSKHVRKVRRND